MSASSAPDTRVFGGLKTRLAEAAISTALRGFWDCFRRRGRLEARRLTAWLRYRPSLYLSLLGLVFASACNAASIPTAAPEATSDGTPRVTEAPANRATPDAPTATSFLWPTLPPSPTPVCPNAPRTRLIVNERGRVLPDDPRPVNLRQAPGTDAPVKALIPIRSVFFVLEGPACGDGYSWFRIRLNGEEGWIAEGDLSSYYVEPYFPG